MCFSVKKLSFCLLFIFSLSSLISQNSQQYESKINELINSHVKSRDPFSGSVLVAHKDQILYRGAFGNSKFNTNQKNTIGSRFFVGSLTKQVTTVAILQLVEKGKIRLEDKLSKWLPQITNSENITIHHLLCHQSGLRRYSHQKFEENTTFYERVLSIKDDTVLFQPSEKEFYSNAGFYALTYILEEVSGLKYEKYFAKHVFKPAKMKFTGVKRKETQSVRNLSVGMGTEPDKYGVDDLNDARYFNSYSFGGGGSLYSTIDDWYNFYLALKSGKLLLSPMVEKMKERWPVTGKSRPNFYHSYGWEILNHKIGRISGFTGRIYGYVSMIRHYEKDDILIVILCNNEFSDRYNIATGIRKIVLGEDYNKNMGKIEQEIPVTASMKKFVGEYDFPEEKTTVKIKIVNNKLTLASHGDDPIYLYPKNENQFFSKFIPLKIGFEKDNDTGSLQLKWNFNDKMIFDLKRTPK